MFLGIGYQHLGWGMNEGVLRWEERIVFHHILLSYFPGEGIRKWGEATGECLYASGDKTVAEFEGSEDSRISAVILSVSCQSGLWIPWEFQAQVACGFPGSSR